MEHKFLDFIIPFLLYNLHSIGRPRSQPRAEDVLLRLNLCVLQNVMALNWSSLVSPIFSRQIRKILNLDLKCITAIKQWNTYCHYFLKYILVAYCIGSSTPHTKMTLYTRSDPRCLSGWNCSDCGNLRLSRRRSHPASEM